MINVSTGGTSVGGKKCFLIQSHVFFMENPGKDHEKWGNLDGHFGGGLTFVAGGFDANSGAFSRLAREKKQRSPSHHTICTLYIVAVSFPQCC